MRWKDPDRRARASYRQFVAFHLLHSLSEKELEAIRHLDAHERGKFLTRLQKALEGDTRYPFPHIRVDRFPSARES